MPAILEIANFALGFWAKAKPLIDAGIDITAQYKAQHAKEGALLAANTAPSAADWQAMHDSLKPLEDSLQSAHRDGT